jgi:O-acetyl-ADP-ribose deacetylase
MIKRKRNKMIKTYVGSIFDYIESEGLDTIMNAANGIGPMGAGIAGAIRKAGGVEIQTDAFRVCKEQDPQPGQAYLTIPGKLEEQGIMKIVHAVTMKQPGGPTSLEIVKHAFKSALGLAYKDGTLKIGCTALGTGIGGLNVKEVAKAMIDIAKEFLKTIDDNMNIIFIDFNKDFIDEIKKHI